MQEDLEWWIDIPSAIFSLIMFNVDVYQKKEQEVQVIRLL